MAILPMPPWVENVMIAAPLLYAIGFFAVDSPLAWGIAGLVTGLLAGSVGYGVMEVAAYSYVSTHLIFWATIGSALSFSTRVNFNRFWNSQGSQPGTPYHAPEPGQPGALPSKNIARITGNAYDSRDASAGIEGVKITIINSGGYRMPYQTTTGHGGTYSIDVPDTGILISDKVSVNADHPSFYPHHSKFFKLSNAYIHPVPLPLDRLVGPRLALGNIKITFADENGREARNIVRPGGWWGAHIEAYAPITFDKGAGRRITGPEDHFELIDENVHAGKLILDLKSSSPKSIGEVFYRGPGHIFIRGRVPSNYQDGTPIPTDKDVKVKLAAHINTT